jgi:hypothetical protein
MIRKRRKLEEMEEELSRMHTHDNEATKAQFTTVGVCHSMQTKAPPIKRMRTNGFGLEQAVVLNSCEQVAAARARLQLRQGQGEMKKAINAAKKDLRATGRTLTRHIQQAEKGMSDTEEAVEKGDKAARKENEAKPCGDKKGAVAEAVVVEKVGAASQNAWQLATQAMKEARGELLAISPRHSNLRAKEADLHKLPEASALVAVEDEDSEVEEADEEEVASRQDSHDPCAVALTNLEVIYEARKGSVQAACTLAV